MSTTTVADYLLDPDQPDWPTILLPWRKLLPLEFSVWLMSRFGDLFLVAGDETVLWLDVADGTVVPVAADWHEFQERIDQGRNAEDWLHPNLVDGLVAAGRTLEPGRCYGLRVSPLDGGAYAADNVVIRSIADQFARTAPRAEGPALAVDDTPMTIRVDYHPGRPKPVKAPGGPGAAIKVDYGRKR